MFASIAKWPEARWSWLLLTLSAAGLSTAALYFQYVMGLEPCIMCIYQRTAVYGILGSALIGLFWGYKHWLGRLLAAAGWGVSSVWGLLIALEHVDIQTAANPFFVVCEIVPNFPRWMALHEWFPGVFAATGDCGNIDWEFLSLSMPQWMVVIFAIYSLLLALVFVSRVIHAKSL